MANRFLLADAFVRVRQTGMTVLTRSFGVLRLAAGKTFRAIGVGVSMLTAQLAPLAAVLAPVLLFGGAIRAAGMFEQSMAKVGAITRASTEDFARLTEKARSLGETTAHSATQAANAMFFFSQKGFDVNQILGAVDSTLNLASAAELDLANATQIASGVMRGMELQVTDLVEVIDTLVNASFTAGTNVPQLGEALRAIGPLGSQAGKSLAELTSAIQVMANVEILGASAGTALRNILLQLSNPPKEAAKALETLNVAVVDLQTGALKPFATIVDELNAAMRDLGPAQKSGILEMLVGRRAVAAFSAMLSVGGDELRRLEDLLGTTGTASRVAGELLDTTFGKLKILFSGISELFISTGEVFKPLTDSLIKLTTSVTGLFNRLGDQLFPEFKKGLAGVAETIDAISEAIDNIEAGDFAFALDKLGELAMSVFKSVAAAFGEALIIAVEQAARVFLIAMAEGTKQIELARAVEFGKRRAELGPTARALGVDRVLEQLQKQAAANVDVAEKFKQSQISELANPLTFAQDLAQPFRDAGSEIQKAADTFLDAVGRQGEESELQRIFREQGLEGLISSLQQTRENQELIKKLFAAREIPISVSVPDSRGDDKAADKVADPIADLPNAFSVAASDLQRTFQAFQQGEDEKVKDAVDEATEAIEEGNAQRDDMIAEVATVGRNIKELQLGWVGGLA